MSDVRDPATDQVAPTPNARAYVQDLVVADIEERKAHGNAYEEVLDLAVYLRGCLAEERGE